MKVRGRPRSILKVMLVGAELPVLSGPVDFLDVQVVGKRRPSDSLESVLDHIFSVYPHIVFVADGPDYDPLIIAGALSGQEPPIAVVAVRDRADSHYRRRAAKTGVHEIISPTATEQEVRDLLVALVTDKSRVWNLDLAPVPEPLLAPSGVAEAPAPVMEPTAGPPEVLAEEPTSRLEEAVTPVQGTDRVTAERPVIEPSVAGPADQINEPVLQLKGAPDAFALETQAGEEVGTEEAVAVKDTVKVPAPIEEPFGVAEVTEEGETVVSVAEEVAVGGTGEVGVAEPAGGASLAEGAEEEVSPLTEKVHLEPTREVEPVSLLTGEGETPAETTPLEEEVVAAGELAAPEDGGAEIAEEAAAPSEVVEEPLVPAAAPLIGGEVTSVSTVEVTEPSAAPTDERERAARGKLIAFVSGKGGVGKTTVVVNAALALAQETKKQVALLDTFIGDTMVLVNGRPRLTLSELPAIVSDMDIDFLRSYAYIHPEVGTHFYAWYFSPERNLPDYIEEEPFQVVLDRLREGYDFILMDTPVTLYIPDLAMHTFADEVYVVAVPWDLLSLRATKVLTLGLQQKYGLRARLILNRVQPDSEVTPEIVAEELGLEIWDQIPNDTRTVIQSVSSGVPPVLSDPRGEFTQAIRRIARKLAGLPVEPARRRWGWL